MTFPFPITPRAPVEVEVDESLFTKIGNMTGGGGLAAAFDGNTNQASAAGALEPGGGVDGTVGINCSASPKVAAKMITTGVNDAGGYYDSVVSMTIYFEGSSDNVSWTELGNSGASNTATSQERTISTTNALSWAYLRARFPTAGGGQVRCAEVRFFELA